MFGKAEVKNILKLGPLDIAKIAAEAQIGGSQAARRGDAHVERRTDIEVVT